METVLTNQVYNGDFLLSQETIPDFPDGWVKTGEDASTVWEWLGPPSGPRAVAIDHPGGPRAGIAQALDVPVQAGDNQRWEAEINLQGDADGVSAYLRVYIGTVSQRVFPLTVTKEPQVFKRVFATPAGTGGLRVEIGITGAGKLIINEVKVYRLYPIRELRLDEKGQIYVRQIDTIGQIQNTVPVRLVNPLAIPVNVQVTSDIRNLTPSRDGVTVYGSGGEPLSTEDGTLQIQIKSRLYKEARMFAVADVTPSSTPVIEVSTLQVYSYAVHNRGAYTASIAIDVSPDGSIWTEDSKQDVKPGKLLILTPRFFLRYTRASFIAPAPTPLTIWFQAQV